jgi:DNA-binding CsgD family transcriptional regulator
VRRPGRPSARRPGLPGWLTTPPVLLVPATGLVNDLAAPPAPGVLVLDDYHLVHAQALHAAVAFLLEHLPPALRLEREQVAVLVESLTERELEVLRLLAARRCNAGIAAELVGEQSTVKTHLIHVYRKWATTAAPRRWPARRGCRADIGRGFHPASPPSGGRTRSATPPS